MIIFKNKKNKIYNKTRKIQIIIISIGLILTIGGTILQVIKAIEHKKNDAAYMAQIYSKRIETTIKEFIDKTDVLKIQVMMLDGELSEEAFYATAQYLDDNINIESVQYLKQGSITYAYPKENNDKILGHSVLLDENRKEDALLAIKTKSVVVSGPYKLLQNKEGFVIQNPIFSKETGEFLGFSTIVLDLNQLLDAWNLKELQKQGYGYGISYEKDGQQIEVVSTHSGLIQYKIKLPIEIGNQEWTFEILPMFQMENWSFIVILLFSGIIITLCLNHLFLSMYESQSLIRKLQLKDKILRYSLEYSGLHIFTYNFKTKQLIFETEGRGSQNLDKVVENAPESIVESIVFEESKQALLEVYKKVEQGAKEASCTIKVKEHEKFYIWERVTLIRVQSEEKSVGKSVGKEDTIIGIIQDITKEKEDEIRLEKERSYREAMILDSIFWIDVELKNNKIIAKNDSFLIDTTNYETLIQTLISERIYPRDAQKLLKTLKREHLYQEYLEHGISNYSLDFRFYKKEKQGYAWGRVKIYLTENDAKDDLNVLVAVFDIDEKMVEQLKLRYQAERDLLTHLYNRTVSEEKINERLCVAKKGQFSILFLVDLDNFKQINDKMGHNQGDKVLKEISTILKTYCKEDAIIGRLGGDEFLVFMQKEGSFDTIVKEAEYQAQLFIDHLKKSYHTGEEIIVVSASIGISIVSNENDSNTVSFNTLYLQADEALYQVKEKDKNGYVIYRKS